MISASTRRLFFLSFFSATASLISTNAFAEWTLNLGYHNPVYSKLGLNFLYWGSQWNFEVGIGWLDGVIDANGKTRDTTNSDTSTKKENKIAAAVAGDLNIKYRFSNGTFSPYFQGGYGAYTGAQIGDNSGATVSLGAPFVGLGFFVGKPSFYGYLAGNYMIDPQNVQVQAGLGFAL
ncbi:MAG: hypothetical protein H7249_07275 [Chitinophagaceae bacterium]|nr:hypothetical protein [Oligoflexus sp.]